MDEIANVSAHYVKSPTFDEHPLHGVFGGVTSAGQISMAIFSERMPIPSRIDIELGSVEGVPGAMQVLSEHPEGKQGIVRFVHGVYYLDVEMAKSMISWLADKIQTFEGMQDAQ